MTPEQASATPAALHAVAERVGFHYVQQRLAMEGQREERAARRRHGPAHWFSKHTLITTGLQWSGLRPRGLRNVLNIQLRHHDITLARLPVAFDGYTILHLSDLHLDINETFVDALADRVRGLRFDACVLTGDFRFRSYGPCERTLHAMARLRPHLGDAVWAVLGNHDSVTMVPDMEAMGIAVLLNEATRITRNGHNIGMAGVDDAHYYQLHDIPKASTARVPEDCNILLSHTPELYAEASRAGFDLMLCGHTHGGQICLPGGIPILASLRTPRTYVRGAWVYGGMAGYTSVGCGASIVDVRLNCLPEVTLHRLRTTTALSP